MERDLKADTKHQLPEVFRNAILTTMCPPSIQDYVFQQSTASQTYKDLKEKIISLSSNRVAIMNNGGPMPMDIGNMNTMNQFEQFKKFQEQLQQNGQTQEQVPVPGYVGGVGAAGYEGYGVDAVGRFTQCFGCGGYGHLARDCPKGGGKGGG